VAKKKNLEAEVIEVPEIPEAQEGYQVITIQKRHWTILAPYAEGHVCTAIEAAVLNQTRAENVRNNWATQMKMAAEKEGRVLEQEDLDAYDQAYVFGLRKTRTSSGPVLSAVDKEEWKLAKQKVMDTLKAKGYKTGKLTDEQKEKVEGFIATFLERGTFRAQAEKIVAERRAAVSDTEEMDFDLEEAA
jgi:hypothetical protein